MNKLMTVVAASVCAVSLSASALAEENPSEKPAGKEAAEAAEEEESDQLFEAGVDLDFFSAYVWRNAVQNDDMVMQPCVWADFTALDPFWFGFSIWQNYDLTGRRSTYRRSLTETDYNVHAGVTAWESEDEELSLGFEIGHEWFSQNAVRHGDGDDSPSTRELYLKATFDNPFVNVYGQVSWMYADFGAYKQSFNYEIGFNKEIEVCDTVTVGADWNVNFADGNYLNYLFGGVSNPQFDSFVDEASGETVVERYDDYDRTPRGGFAGTTVKCYAAWAITDWMSLRATIAYTGLLNGSLRDAIGDMGSDYDFYGSGDGYPRDLLWGGLSLNFTF